jgi:hypothetical protein
MYLMFTPRGETKMSPMPAPFFIKELWKYIAQYSWLPVTGGV